MISAIGWGGEASCSRSCGRRFLCVEGLEAGGGGGTRADSASLFGARGRNAIYQALFRLGKAESHQSREQVPRCCY